MAMRKFAPQPSQPWSPPSRFEGEGQGGGVDKQRFSEAVGVADFCTPY
jgi:hypothetical protein